MVLATHAVVGGAVASLFPSHPVEAFVAGFVSHFILDAIPHWDYKLLSAYAGAKDPAPTDGPNASKYFAIDLAHIGADLILGVVLTLLIWQPVGYMAWKILALGVIGGILPDFLQFVYVRFPHQPMILIQKFQDFMQAEYKIHNPYLGVFLQATVAVIVVLLVKYMIRY